MRGPLEKVPTLADVTDKVPPVRVAFVAAAVVAAFVLGALIVVQTGINVELGKSVGGAVAGAIRASFLSFCVGGSLLAAIVAAGPERGPAPDAEFPRWLWVAGGLLGSSGIATIVVVAPSLGLSLMFVTLVCGQLIASLAIDAIGFLGAPKRPMSLRKVAGLALVIAGASGGGAPDGLDPLELVLLVVAAAAAGACFPVQSSVNRLCARYLGDAYRASLLSFGVGAAFLGLISLVTLYTRLESDIAADELWLFLGGVIGVGVVVGGTVLPRYLSMALYYCLLVAGQLSCAVVMDHYGAFSFQRKRATLQRVAFVVLALGGTVLVALTRAATPAAAGAQQTAAEDRKEAASPSRARLELPDVRDADELDQLRV